MERKEQIEQAKAELFPIGDNGRSYELALSASGFDLGVKWADESPKQKRIPSKIRNCIIECLTVANGQRFEDYETTLEECIKWLNQCDYLDEYQIDFLEKLKARVQGKEE